MGEMTVREGISLILQVTGIFGTRNDIEVDGAVF